MYCSNCGNEVSDKAEICVKCGCRVNKAPQQQAKEPDAPNIAYTVLGFFVPIAGLILFLIWHDEYPLRAKSAGKGALISVIVGACLIALYIVLIFVFIFTGLTMWGAAANTFLSLLISL